MKKNKKSILIVIFLLLATNLTTFMVSRYKILGIKNFIKSNYLWEVDEQKLDDGIYKGIVASLGDPYSNYWTKEEYEALDDDLAGILYGIGVQITMNDRGEVEIIAPIKDSPSEEIGIISGDIIQAVDDELVGDKTLTEVTEMIKGELGTKVKVTIRRTDEDNSELLDFEVVRAKINLESVHYEPLEGDMAYINISSFSLQTGNEFRKVLADVQENNSKGIILDLRSNPGGSLSACVDVADQILGEGKIVYTERRDGTQDDMYYSDPHMNDLPMVVLINQGSASASEIVAGAIRDHKRALLIGENTYGKGIVQTMQRLKDGAGISLTISEYYLPNGESIHKKGVAPDIEVVLNEGVKRIGLTNIEEDNQLQYAIEELRGILESY
ncbi:MAG: S41 family peptidase [Tissierellia bacterium]|nr:S41 family peptidase [Tissierellia bacterium]